MILAGDVGGTKCQLGLFESGGSPRRATRTLRTPSGDYDSIESLLLGFLDERDGRPDHVVLGVAGPVVENRCEATNLPWVIDGAAVGAALGGADVTLINDLEATGWSLPLLEPADLATIQPGDRVPGNRALIAAGTGLGESLLFHTGSGWRPSASEGGHTDFAPRDALEDELLAWLRGRHGRVSYERILSGRGLAELYRFLSETNRGAEPPGMAERFANAEDPAVVVTEAALDGSCERARLTLAKFAEVYGAEAGNLALKALAIGGVFVAGGIAPRILPFLTDGVFRRAFAEKGRLSDLLERVPVHVILDPRAALWGAAAHALSRSGAAASAGGR